MRQVSRKLAARMGHPEIENETGFVLEPLYLLDEHCRTLLVPVLKASFTIERDGHCRLAVAQEPLRLVGDYWGPDPATSSLRYEPEVAFHKPATDVVFIGEACANTASTREMLVEVQLGPCANRLLATGDRMWSLGFGSPRISEPAPFERLPIIYERAFGGWDRTSSDPALHSMDARNPVGTGYRRTRVEDGLPLPNFEDPAERIRHPLDQPAPAGFGFIAAHWQPRVGLAGTYDERWESTRSPLLPTDFDRRHLNAASPGLVAPGYLRGNESGIAIGMTPGAPMSFSLPGIAPPRVLVTLRDGRETCLETVLDTVIVEPGRRQLALLWRALLVLNGDPLDVKRLCARVGG